MTIKTYTYNGESFTSGEWARRIDVKPDAMSHRIRKNNYKVDASILKKRLPRTSRAKIFIEDENGNKHSLNDIAKSNGLPYSVVLGRYKYGKRHRNIQKLGAPLYSL